MRASISAVAAVFLFALGTFTAETTLGSESEPGCGRPSDLHDGWMIGSPEQQGFYALPLCAMGKGIVDGKLANVDSIVVVRHGVLVYEHYFGYPNQQSFAANIKHVGNSMIKSIVSLLVGIAVDRGLIKDIDAPVAPYFPENADLRSPDKARITLRHLLTMSAGLEWHEIDTPYSQPANSSNLMFHSSDPYHYVLQQRVVAPAGEIWNYNSGTSKVIIAILTKVTGKALDELARTELFEPLGIKDVSWSGSRLSLRPRDWAKIGQLVLNHGVWEGKQIVPAPWVAQSTAEHIKARQPFSYGYQWWLGHSLSGNRAIEWVAAMGFNSQKVIIIPELDTVVVFNASRESKNMVAPEIDLLDNYILPSILKQ